MIFGKRKKHLPDLITEDELNLVSALNFDTVVEWLIGLSDDDYEKVVLTVPCYRNADADAAKILGRQNKPVTFINPPAMQVMQIDSLEPVFLDDEPKAKSKKIKVNQ